MPCFNSWEAVSSLFLHFIVCGLEVTRVNPSDQWRWPVRQSGQLRTCRLCRIFNDRRFVYFLTSVAAAGDLWLWRQSSTSCYSPSSSQILWWNACSSPGPSSSVLKRTNCTTGAAVSFHFALERVKAKVVQMKKQKLSKLHYFVAVALGFIHCGRCIKMSNEDIIKS